MDDKENAYRVCLSGMQALDLKEVVQALRGGRTADPDVDLKASVEQEDAVGCQLFVGQLQHVWHFDAKSAFATSLAGGHLRAVLGLQSVQGEHARIYHDAG